MPDTDAKDAALLRAREAIAAWMHQYAGELCDPADVEAHRQRVSDAGGTLDYIVQTFEVIDATLKGGAERDFEMMLRRVCHRFRNSDDPKVKDVVAQARDLLKRKGTASILRDGDDEQAG